MDKEHHYTVFMDWVGNKGEGTSHYRSYSRDHVIRVNGKAEIPTSADPSFRGSPDRYNPEELLVASISSCHMLWYLHLCAVNQVVVLAYHDQARGTMVEDPDGSGRFKEVELHPMITLASPAMIPKATELHGEANRLCFIANSCNFPIHHDPVFQVDGTTS